MCFCMYVYTLCMYILYVCICVNVGVWLCKCYCICMSMLYVFFVCFGPSVYPFICLSVCHSLPLSLTLTPLSSSYALDFLCYLCFSGPVFLLGFSTSVKVLLFPLPSTSSYSPTSASSGNLLSFLHISLSSPFLLSLYCLFLGIWGNWGWGLTQPGMGEDNAFFLCLRESKAST